ncbi:uracil-DNA glycosylase family protein [Sphingobium sp. HBC34]|uniref:Uracil-DNA glycosylase family protein n=1 Tax=Sphingobium cyanobacteriorum TaxID=3063954 RepID=A0ABT8ZL47_9SPHN|nr:uracil-DNA glycosylase family protein [Sphingobium sp. HBC34]MDO7835259.1 uracil-DNA glycosylase family protein [Sphingobium sp. HBC34]
MRGSMQDNAALAVDAFMAWWQLAGVDSAVVETPVNWLRPMPAAASGLPTGSPADPAAPPKPRDLATFHQWLESDSAHPERRWPARTIYPAGAADAPLMIVTDMPDPADIDAGILFADRAGALFDAMLRAIGLDRSQIYIASLFFARPPGGMVEAGDLTAVAARMRTHVHLARPRRLLLLGDRTIRALMPTDGDAPPDSLREFNHDGGTVPAVATFHPRLLLGQPAAKAECWRVLQSLIEEARP